MRYLREEGRLLAGGVDFPPLHTRFRDRHALVVARGPGIKRDLRIVRAVHPRLQAGARRGRRRRRRAARGRLQAARDRRRHGLGLGRGAPLRRRARRPRVRGRRRARRRAARPARAPVPAPSPRPGSARTSRCCSRYEKGAELIVAVGTHFNLIEFLERNRAGMSSTFVTRLKVGEILVDAKGVSRLVSRRVGVWPLVVLRARGPRRDRHRGARLAAAAARDRARQPAHPEPARALGCRRSRQSASCSRRARTCGRSSPSRTTCRTGGPGIGGLQPDRRGLAPGARWQIVGDEPSVALPQAEHDAGRCSSWPSSRTSGSRSSSPASGSRPTCACRAPRPDRTLARLTVAGPALVGLKRARCPTRALARLHALVQTAADL